MGNRAVIAFERTIFVDYKSQPLRSPSCIGIYLHWNGGRDSVEGFLQVAKDYGLRSCSYGVARLSQIISNYMGGTLSVGVDIVKHLDCDNFDNGTYWVDSGFNIVGRDFFEDGIEQSVYPLDEMVEDIKMKNNEHFNK